MNGCAATTNSHFVHDIEALRSRPELRYHHTHTDRRDSKADSFQAVVSIPSLQ
jgi:hypothetical protein